LSFAEAPAVAVLMAEKPVGREPVNSVPAVIATLENAPTVALVTRMFPPESDAVAEEPRSVLISVSSVVYVCAALPTTLMLFVTPSTILAVSGPKSRSISSTSAFESSTASCRRPATTVTASIFQPGDRVELVGGQLVVREPQGSPHAVAVQLAEDALRVAFGPGWVVRVQMPVALDDESEPEPDVAVVPGTARDYRHGHPTHAVLVVEVAESSLRRDREDKGGLYARAGIADYWIVRKKQLRLEDLYLAEGAYRYRGGWNLAAVAATLAGCALAWGGLVVPPLKPLYDYAWFVGFAVAFGLYVLLMRGATPTAGD